MDMIAFRKVKVLAFTLFIAENITLDRSLPVFQQKLLQSFFCLFFKGLHIRMPEMHVEILTPGGLHTHMDISWVQHIHIPRLERYRFSVFLQIHDPFFYQIYNIFVCLSAPVHIGRLNHHRICQSDRRQILQVYPVKHINHFPFPAG